MIQSLMSRFVRDIIITGHAIEVVAIHVAHVSKTDKPMCLPLRDKATLEIASLYLWSSCAPLSHESNIAT